MPNYDRNSAGSTKGMISDNDVRPIRIDRSTHTMQTIEYEHHEIHSGNLFAVEEGIQLSNASRVYLIRPPALPLECHFSFWVVGAQDTSYAFVRNSGYDPGNVVTPYNLNELSTNTPQTQINIAASGAGAPTTIASGQFGIPAVAGGRGGDGGQGGARIERILNPALKYALTVTALSANANNITVYMFFYEHTPKN